MITTNFNSELLEFDKLLESEDKRIEAIIKKDIGDLDITKIKWKVGHDKEVTYNELLKKAVKTTRFGSPDPQIFELLVEFIKSYPDTFNIIKRNRENSLKFLMLSLEKKSRMLKLRLEIIRKSQKEYDKLKSAYDEVMKGVVEVRNATELEQLRERVQETAKFMKLIEEQNEYKNKKKKAFPMKEKDDKKKKGGSQDMDQFAELLETGLLDK